MKILVDIKWVVNPDDGAWELYKGYTHVDNHFRTSGLEWEKVIREGTYQIDRGYEFQRDLTYNLSSDESLNLGSYVWSDLVGGRWDSSGTVPSE